MTDPLVEFTVVCKAFTASLIVSLWCYTCWRYNREIKDRYKSKAPAQNKEEGAAAVQPSGVTRKQQEDLQRRPTTGDHVRVKETSQVGLVLDVYYHPTEGLLLELQDVHSEQHLYFLEFDVELIDFAEYQAARLRSAQTIATAACALMLLLGFLGFFVSDARGYAGLSLVFFGLAAHAKWKEKIPCIFGTAMPYESVRVLGWPLLLLLLGCCVWKLRLASAFLLFVSAGYVANRIVAQEVSAKSPTAGGLPPEMLENVGERPNGMLTCCPEVCQTSREWANKASAVAFLVFAVLGVCSFSNAGIIAQACLYFCAAAFMAGSNWTDTPMRPTFLESLLARRVTLAAWCCASIYSFVFPWHVTAILWFSLCLAYLAVLGLWIRRSAQTSANEEMSDRSDERDTILGPALRVSFCLSMVWGVVVVSLVGYTGFVGDVGIILWGTSSAAAVAQTLRSLLQLKRKIPLWINMTVCFIKPIVLTTIFGVPKTTGRYMRVSKVKRYVVVPFFITLTGVAILTDVRHISLLMLSGHLNDWHEVCGIAWTFGVSSNMQTALAFGTMLINYQTASRGHVGKAIYLMGTSQGWPWLIVMGITALIYLPIILVIGMMVLPGLVAYFWLTFPFFGVAYLYWKFLQRESHNDSSLVASLLGTKAIAASGMLGALGDAPPRDAKGHILLPMKRNCSGVCDGESPERIPRIGAERRRAKRQCNDQSFQRHPCIQQYDKDSIVFVCVGCYTDLCANCYAEEKAHTLGGTSESWIAKVLDLHKSNVLAQGDFQEAQSQVMMEEAKQWALTLIPLVPVVGAFVPMFVPVVCRFYIGCGYLNAVVDTWNDRHVPDFLHGLVKTGERGVYNAGLLAHFFGTGKFDLLLELIVEWLQTLNYVI